MLDGLRPLVLPSRLEDPAEKIGFQDEHWVKAPGGHGRAAATETAIYVAVALRNAGRGLAVLNGWAFRPDRVSGAVERPDPGGSRRLTRDLCVPAGDLGFWQGALRDPSDQDFVDASKSIIARQSSTTDLLYGDGEGGQRVITRFILIPRGDDSWFAAVSRHWNLDRPTGDRPYCAASRRTATRWRARTEPNRTEPNRTEPNRCHLADPRRGGRRYLRRGRLRAEDPWIS